MLALLKRLEKELEFRKVALDKSRNMMSMREESGEARFLDGFSAAVKVARLFVDGNVEAMAKDIGGEDGEATSAG